MRAPRPDAARRRSDLKIAAACAGFVAVMVGMAFAAVPLYDLFCRVTGFGGTPQRADAAPAHVLDRIVKVRFDANVAGDLGWSFAPEANEVALRVGETGMMIYAAENAGATRSIGTATFNVTPPQAGPYFVKIQCFCFTEQGLEPGERMDMPVVFYVDPAIAENAELAGLTTITLSYTFFRDAEAEARDRVAMVPSDGAAN